MHLFVKQQFLVGNKTEGIESVYVTSCFEKQVYITKLITDGLAYSLIYLIEKLNVINILNTLIDLIIIDLIHYFLKNNNKCEF